MAFPFTAVVDTGSPGETVGTFESPRKEPAHDSEPIFSRSDQCAGNIRPYKSTPRKIARRDFRLSREIIIMMKKSSSQRVESASRLIDARIQELGDWRGEMLSRLRALIQQADPEVVEEWKWETPVWSHDGLICTGETYKNVVKMTFAKGASVDDPSGLFNSSLEGRVRRAIDFREGGKVNEKALKTLIRAAVALNTSSGRKKASKARSE